MGVTASFLMECVQRGYLTKKEIGYDLNWGDIDAAERILCETALGKGFGQVCGQGVLRAKKWVAEQYVKRTGKSYQETMNELNKFGMEVKGLEFSMYITKESLAQQGGYGFALKGPQHDEAWLIFIDQVHKEIPSFKMKPALPSSINGKQPPTSEKIATGTERVNASNAAKPKDSPLLGNIRRSSSL